MRELIKKLGIERPSNWNERLFFPVIHLPNLEKAFEAAVHEALVALESAADGVILISHGDLDPEELSWVWEHTNNKVGSWFPVGINWLSLTRQPSAMITRANSLGAKLLWSDAWFGKEEVQSARRETGWEGAYCGAVAFKAGPDVPLEQIPNQLKHAYEYMDLPITSGPGTGEPIDMVKALVCHEAAEGRPLGIASGVSMENIHSLLPLFNVFLVASSLSLDGDWYHQDPKKTRAMAEVINRYRP